MCTTLEEEVCPSNRPEQTGSLVEYLQRKLIFLHCQGSENIKCIYMYNL